MATSARRPRQSDIAARMGVSISTVSRALANDGGISEAVREQVLQVARSVGYLPKHQSRSRGAGDRAVALVPLGGATGGLASFYVGIVDGMREAARIAGFQFDVRLVNDHLITPAQIQHHISETGARALLLAGIDPSEELLDWLREEEIVVILVNGSDPKMQVSSVSPANHYGGMLATEKLLEAGHRRLLHYTHPHGATKRIRPTILERLRGFRTAIGAVPGAEGRILSTADYSSIELVERLAGADADVTAVFCWNDIAAVQLMDDLNRTQAKVSPYLSIVGFDDLPYAQMTSPRLSTIHIDREAIGRAAIRLMLEHLAGEQAVQQLEIGVSFAEGGTIHRLPAAH